MPLYRLTRKLSFPNPERALPDGLLAVGGDLGTERLLLAYSQGIFPWYSPGDPILWWSPDPRMVLLPEEFHVPTRLARLNRHPPYQFTLDEAFAAVMAHCASIRRPGQKGTWITKDMLGAYNILHTKGLAHSAEAWDDGELVGGIYGVSLGACFFGESMFAKRPDASKLVFVRLVEQMKRWGFNLVDCQVYTEHLSRFGAREIPRITYLEQLGDALQLPTRVGKWRWDDDFAKGERESA